MDRRLAILTISLGVIVNDSAARNFAACTDHSIDGYYVGMSREDATSLRSVEASTTDSLVVRESDKTTAIKFDAAGNLTSLEQKREHVDADALNRSLLTEFGPSTKESREATDATKATPRVIRSLWKDPACNQRVEVVYTYRDRETRAVIRLTSE